MERWFGNKHAPANTQTVKVLTEKSRRNSIEIHGPSGRACGLKIYTPSSLEIASGRISPHFTIN